MNDLKPCPHCGGPVHLGSILEWEDNGICREFFVIRCIDCDLSVKNMAYADSRGEFVEKWNRRAQQ